MTRTMDRIEAAAEALFNWHVLEHIGTRVDKWSLISAIADLMRQSEQAATTIQAQAGRIAELETALKADADELEYYIGNPSAWDSYDDAMSERLRRVHSRARSLLQPDTGEK